MKYSAFCLLFILFTLTSEAQPSTSNYVPANPKGGKITGKVYDEGLNKPMEFSSIALYKSIDSSLVTGTISSNDGSFTLNNLPHGKYYLIANFMGFEKSFVNSVIINEDNPVIDIGIIKLSAAAQNLDEIEVVATQKRVEYKIDRKIINVSQDLNAAGGSAADVLQNTPSVTVDIDGNVSLRGSGNFTVLIDGKPTPLSGNDALQTIPATSIENIEIITNPSAKFDPDGMAGIINIIMKKNALQGLSGIFNTTIGTGDKYSGNFLLSYKTKKYNIFGGMDFQDNTYAGSLLSMRELNPDSAIRSMVEVGGSRNSFNKGLEFKTGIDLYLNESNTLSFGVERGNDAHNHESRTNMHAYTLPASYDTFDISEALSTRESDYYNFSANFSKKFDQQGHELVASVSYQIEDGMEITEENEFPTDEFYKLLPIPAARIRSREFGDEYQVRGNVDYTRPLSENGKLETGYQVRFDNNDEQYIFEDYDPDKDAWSNNSSFSSGNYFKRNIQSLYATYSDKIGKYEYMLGLRGEYTDRTIRQARDSKPFAINRLDFFPTLHFSRQFKGENQILASYSRRINRPGGWNLEPFRTYINSYTLREGNPSLKPEYANSFELNYQKTFGTSFFVIESYFRNTQNLITRISYQDPALPGVVIMSSENVNSDNSAGAEFMLNLSVKKWLNLNSSFNVYRYWLDGVIDGEKVNRKSNNWDTRFNSSFFISPISRVQLNLMYNGPSATAQGERGAFYFANIAYRRDFLDRKLSATVSLQDIFGTMKMKFKTDTPAMINTFRYEREHQVVMFTLSYKLNNFKNQTERGEGSGPAMMDDGGAF